MTLDNITRGQTFKILSIADPKIKAQTLRFGLVEGEIAELSEIIPKGPVIIKKKRQEIVLGRGLAKSIQVELV